MSNPLPKIKLRVMTQFPAAVDNGFAINATKTNGRYRFDFDASGFVQITHVADDQIANQFVVAINVFDGSYSLLPFNIAVANKVIVEKTSAGAVNVGEFDQIILVNKTTPETTTVNLPLASTKVGAVKVVDFAANAGTYNITIVASGTDKINGQSQWVLGGDGASVTLDPVSGGWAL